MEYKGFFIEDFKNGVLVDYCGDEVFFLSKEDAMLFIDDVTEMDE